MKRDPDFQFRQKGNEKQFTFNEDINDSIQSAAAMLEKVESTTTQETAALKSAKETAPARYKGHCRASKGYPLSRQVGVWLVTSGSLPTGRAAGQ